MGTLGGHFLVRGAKARNEFVLAVDHDVGVDRSLFKVTLVLIPCRDTFVVGSVNIAHMGRPRPVRRTSTCHKAFLGRSTQGFATAVLVDTAREAKVNTHTRRRLNRSTTQRNRNIPVIFTRRRIVGIFKFHRHRMAQIVTQRIIDAFAILVYAGLVKAGFIVGLANIFVHQQGAFTRHVIFTRFGFNIFGLCRHIESQRKIAKRAFFVVGQVQVQEVHAAKFILVHAHVKVVMCHRSRKLVRHSVIVGAALHAIAFDAVIIGCLFLKPTNLHIVETGRNPRNIRVDVTRIPGHLVIAGQGRIPVNL